MTKTLTRYDLEKHFDIIADIFRMKGVTVGTDRTKLFCSILFYKLISNQPQFKNVWSDITHNFHNKEDFTNEIIQINQSIERHFNKEIFFNINEVLFDFENVFKLIGEIDLESLNTDIKGDAFEYFLKETKVKSDLGQYFTPLHIVNLMINILKPKENEVIYDPFCGTGGFLIHTFDYLKEKFRGEPQLLGRDIDGTVIKLATMSMILKGGLPNFVNINTLANPIENEFDCILTNIPFSQKMDDDYSKLYFNSIAPKRLADGACILHCFKALKKGGRMCVLVPEGFLYRKDLMKVRKYILENSTLELVVSLPQGVFLPYTGVKTSILYFTNAHCENTQEDFNFFEINNDGYSLNSKRAKLEGLNDVDILLGELNCECPKD